MTGLVNGADEDDPRTHSRSRRDPETTADQAPCVRASTASPKLSLAATLAVEPTAVVDDSKRHRSPLITSRTPTTVACACRATFVIASCAIRRTSACVLGSIRVYWSPSKRTRREARTDRRRPRPFGGRGCRSLIPPSVELRSADTAWRASPIPMSIATRRHRPHSTGLEREVRSHSPARRSEAWRATDPGRARRAARERAWRAPRAPHARPRHLASSASSTFATRRSRRSILTAFLEAVQERHRTGEPKQIAGRHLTWMRAWIERPLDLARSRRTRARRRSIRR